MTRTCAEGLLALLALLLTASGCGAKTGLDVPDTNLDSGPIDAAPSIDARLPDAGRDAWVPPPPCVEVPLDDPRATVALEIPARLRVVDVMFLIDSSASMQDEIDAVRDGLRGLVVPRVRAAIPDAAFGVALFGEFPVRPHGPPSVRPYELRQTITEDVSRMEAALDDTPVWGNLDDPEAAIEGLYQVATGAGLSPWITASFGCPNGGIGGGCFREDAFRVVMLITDAPMHNGPPGVPPIANYSFSPPPHGYRETVDAARALDLLVLGLGATDVGRPSPLDHLAQLARDTGSLSSRGPLVFDIGRGGDRIGSDVVSAIEQVAQDVPIDVNAAVEDVPGDDVDARDVVRGARALRAMPADGFRAIDGSQFLGVRPGTMLTFELDIDVSGLMPSPEPRRYRVAVRFTASGSLLDRQELLIVIPAGGMGCPE